MEVSKRREKKNQTTASTRSVSLSLSLTRQNMRSEEKIERQVHANDTRVGMCASERKGDREDRVFNRIIITLSMANEQAQAAAAAAASSAVG